MAERSVFLSCKVLYTCTCTTVSLWLYMSRLWGQRTKRPLLVVYGSSGWEVSALEVVAGSCCGLDEPSQGSVGGEGDWSLFRWGVPPSAERSEQCSVVLAASVFGCSGTRAHLIPQCKSMGWCVIWQRWQGSTFWILGWVPFSLGHLGEGAEDHLQICCYGRISDLLFAGSNIAWRLGCCMLWVWVAHKERGVCFLGVCPSVAVLVTGWLLPAGLSCNPGG